MYGLKSSEQAIDALMRWVELAHERCCGALDDWVVWRSLDNNFDGTIQLSEMQKLLDTKINTAQGASAKVRAQLSPELCCWL